MKRQEIRSKSKILFLECDELHNHNDYENLNEILKKQEEIVEIWNACNHKFYKTIYNQKYRPVEVVKKCLDCKKMIDIERICK